MTLAELNRKPPERERKQATGRVSVVAAFALCKLTVWSVFCTHQTQGDVLKSNHGVSARWTETD